MKLNRLLFKAFRRKPAVCLLILAAGMLVAVAAWLALDARAKERRGQSGEIQ